MYLPLAFPNINPPARTDRQARKGKNKPSLFTIIYIWPTGGDGFWAWITEKNCKCISGYKWNRNNWIVFRMNLNKISDFREL